MAAEAGAPIALLLHRSGELRRRSQLLLKPSGIHCFLWATQSDPSSPHDTRNLGEQLSGVPAMWLGGMHKVLCLLCSLPAGKLKVGGRHAVYVAAWKLCDPLSRPAPPGPEPDGDTVKIPPRHPRPGRGPPTPFRASR